MPAWFCEDLDSLTPAILDRRARKESLCEILLDAEVPLLGIGIADFFSRSVEEQRGRYVRVVDSRAPKSGRHCQAAG